MIELRKYQKDCINKIYKAIGSGRNRIAVSLPTGAGKSIILSKIASDAASRGKRTLILVHRKALVGQLTDACLSFGITPYVIASGFKPQNKGSLVIIAMLQTLEKRLLPEGVDVLMLDEAHLTSYFNCFEQCLNKYLGEVWALSKKPVIGFSATFWRTKSREGYCKYFNYKVQGISPRELINQGFLTNPRLFIYDTLDVGQLTTDGSGEYSLESIRKVCNEKYLDDVLDKWLDNFKHCKTVFFTSTVAQAKYLVGLVKAASIDAEIITGSTNKLARDRMLSDFKSGKLRVLVSVSTLTEGFDEPSIECVVLARPSKSQALIVQMIGRGLRTHENKKEVFILDLSNCVNNLLKNPRSLPESDEDDIFTYNDFTTCPSDSGKKRLFVNEKSCQSCGQLMNSLLMVCPHCGEVQAAKSVSIVPDNVVFPQLIEYKSPSEIRLHRKLREAIYKGFFEGVSIYTTILNFTKENDLVIPHSWSFGAIFKDKYKEFNYSFYKWYLSDYQKLPQTVTDYCLSLEFGNYINDKVFDWANIKFDLGSISEGQSTAVNKLISIRGMENVRIHDKVTN